MDIGSPWDQHGLDLFKIAVIPLAVLVVFTLHELGHYAAARFFGMRIESFSLGYGRILLDRRDRRGVQWSVRLFPICGHVHLAAGQNDPAPDLYQNRPRWQRLTTVLAGPLVNIALPFFLFLPFFALVGRPSIPPVINGVEVGSVADRHGLQPGDRFLAADGREIRGFEDVRRLTYPEPSRPLTFTILRKEERLNVRMLPELSVYRDEDGVPRSHGRIGVLARHMPYRLEAVTSVNGHETGGDDGKARALLLEETGRDAVVGMHAEDGKTHDYRMHLYAEVNKGLRDPDSEDYASFFAGPLTDNVFAPLGPAQSVTEALRLGGEILGNALRVPFQLLPLDKKLLNPEVMPGDEAGTFPRLLYRFLYLTATLSVLVALINLIPVPGLDGAQIFTMASDAVLGAERATAHRGALFAGVLLLLYGLVLLCNLDDMRAYIEFRLEQVRQLMGGA